MERKLASIRRIDKITKHPNADSLEICNVGGWRVITRIGEFQEGALAIYFEIDSYLPIENEFEFLRKSSYKKMGDIEGFRLKTIKLRQELSQGLLLPLSILESKDDESEMKIGISEQPWGDQLQLGPYDDAIVIEEGSDVTDYLGVLKYEPPIPAQLAGKVKGGFPGFIRKTDEERCLSGDTIITTENGPMTIREICEGGYTGKVLSYNPIKDQNEMNVINSHSIQNTNNDWYEIELESGKIIRTTGNHRIWIQDLNCFREVCELIGNETIKRIFMLDKIKSIKKIQHDSKRYDIGVESVNNFYANDILVHNCQNLTKEYETMKDNNYYVTEKLDGTSGTFYFRDGVFGVCSRNLELLDPSEFVPGTVICEDGIERQQKENTYWKIAKELRIEEKLGTLEQNFCIQGEIIGEGIQGNPYKIKGQKLKVFNVFNIDTQEYLGLEEIEEFLNKIDVDSFKIEMVPVLEREFKLPDTIEELLKYAENKSLLNPETEREGVVIRNRNKTISFKAISNTFLIKSVD